MTNSQTIRVWPSILILLTMLTMMIVPSFIVERTKVHFFSLIGGPVLCMFLVCVWWIGFSGGVPGRDRWIVVAMIVVGSVLASLPVVITYKQPPLHIVMHATATLVTLWVTWLTLTVALPTKPRITGVKLLIVLVLGTFSLLRIDGTSAGMFPELTAIWSQKPEDAAVDLNNRELVRGKPIVDVTTVDWAEFRGLNRDNIRPGISIQTDWGQHQPKLLWKQKIAPGWGSFSVVGERLYTQEQRGSREVVVCYDASTGGEIWRHFEDAKFTESIAGAGPRATPTVVDGKVYAQGATGILVCLNAESGDMIWRTDIKADTSAILQQWGYASSPLLYDKLVITYTGGPGKGLSAFDLGTGKLVWSSGDASHSYSSPQLYRNGDRTVVLLVSNIGLEAFDPTTGKLAWTHEWKFGKDINRSCQPAILPDGDILFSTGVGGDQGMRRITIKDNNPELKWQSRHMRAYFNDGVAFKNHYYGIDGKSLTCINLDDGSFKWSAGTIYGEGQVLLLADQGLLLVLAVDGTVALVDAKPDEYNEIARMKAIRGKTWNHPVVSQGRLYIRNGIEAAAYELPVK